MAVYKESFAHIVNSKPNERAQKKRQAKVLEIDTKPDDVLLTYNVDNTTSCA